jgi:hydrogenase maturation factor HypF (carbamoyltransferase family)
MMNYDDLVRVANVPTQTNDLNKAAADLNKAAAAVKEARITAQKALNAVELACRVSREAKAELDARITAFNDLCSNATGLAK